MYLYLDTNSISHSLYWLKEGCNRGAGSKTLVPVWEARFKVRLQAGGETWERPNRWTFQFLLGPMFQPERCYQSDLRTHNVNSPHWAARWHTKGFFQHVFRSVALFKQPESPVGVAWQRTFSNQRWQWWNASGTVQELQWNAQWWECWLRPRVRVCVFVWKSFSTGRAMNRGPFDVWHFESAQMFGENSAVWRRVGRKVLLSDSSCHKVEIHRSISWLIRTEEIY